MVEEESFSIEIGEPSPGDGSLEPNWGPLYELPLSEVSFRKFCFEHNHEVHLRVGTMGKTFLLFPDIVLAYPELVDVPRLLRQKVGSEVPFSSHGFDLVFEPKANGVECRIQEFGYLNGSVSCLADQADIEAVIAGFVKDLSARVVEAGSLMPETPSRDGV